MQLNHQKPELSQLGQKTEYDPNYNPDKLFPIPRQDKRTEIGISNALPFFGFDLWNHYEVSWLNEKGKPVVALAEISYNADTPYLIESKSMKLYFNSFNNTHFKDELAVESLVKKDLEVRVGGPVTVKIIPLHNVKDSILLAMPNGECLDELDVECHSYRVDHSLLTTGTELVTEILFSNLLKSNCLVTNQPDWASVEIAYRGKKINREGLLRYLVSFRNHNEFHEQCIERIFVDILNYCQPEKLSVYGRYTRRGGLDINPYRSTEGIVEVPNMRLCRQ